MSNRITNRLAAFSILIAVMSLVVTGVQSYVSAIQSRTAEKSLDLQARATDAELISNISLSRESPYHVILHNESEWVIEQALLRVKAKVPKNHGETTSDESSETPPDAMMFFGPDAARSCATSHFDMSEATFYSSSLTDEGAPGRQRWAGPVAGPHSVEDVLDEDFLFSVTFTAPSGAIWTVSESGELENEGGPEWDIYDAFLFEPPGSTTLDGRPYDARVPDYIYAPSVVVPVPPGGNRPSGPGYAYKYNSPVGCASS